VKKEASYKKQKEASDKVNKHTNNLYITKSTMFLGRFKQKRSIYDDKEINFTNNLYTVSKKRH